MTPENLTKLYDALRLMHEVRMATLHPTGPGFFDIPTIEPGTEGLADIIANLREMTLALDPALSRPEPKTAAEMFDGMI